MCETCSGLVVWTAEQDGLHTNRPSQLLDQCYKFPGLVWVCIPLVWVYIPLVWVYIPFCLVSVFRPWFLQLHTVYEQNLLAFSHQAMHVGTKTKVNPLGILYGFLFFSWLGLGLHTIGLGLHTIGLGLHTLLLGFGFPTLVSSASHSL